MIYNQSPYILLVYLNSKNMLIFNKKYGVFIKKSLFYRGA